MSLKHLRKLDKWRTKRQIFRPKLSTTDKQYLKIASLRNKKKIQKRLDRMGDTSGPSVDPSTDHQWLIRKGQWEGGCQEAILKEEKQGEKTRACQITQDLG